MIFVCLYRIAPRILDALTIVEPETVVRWHRVRLSLLLALEIASACRQAKRPAGNSAADPEDQSCQSALGRSTHPWRTPQARHRCRPDLRRQVHGAAKTTSVARLENVPSQSCRRDRLNRPLRGPDDLIQVIVRPSNSST